MAIPTLQRNSTTGRIQEVIIPDAPEFFTASQSTGSTIAAYKAVAYAGSSTIRLADSGITNDYPVMGFTTAAITTGGSGLCQAGGLLTGFSGLTAGAIYFSDPATPGGITTTVPVTTGTKSQRVGFAASTSTLQLQIEQPILVGATVSPSNGITVSGTVQGLVVNATSKLQLNGISFIEEGTTFPASPSNEQRYKHQNYRSWFTYYTADGKWLQEAPGNFSGSFPTVTSGDNTIAPGIEVKRRDLSNIVFYYDGTNWDNVTSNFVILSAAARISDDSTARTANYTADYSCWGVNTLGGTPLPSNMKSCLFKVTVLGTTAATLVSVRLEDPSNVTGATSLSGWIGAAGGGYTGTHACGIHPTLGTIRYTLVNLSGGTNRVVIDVTGYIY